MYALGLLEINSEQMSSTFMQPISFTFVHMQ